MTIKDCIPVEEDRLVRELPKAKLCYLKGREEGVYSVLNASFHRLAYAEAHEAADGTLEMGPGFSAEIIELDQCTIATARDAIRDTMDGRLHPAFYSLEDADCREHDLAGTTLTEVLWAMEDPTELASIEGMEYLENQGRDMTVGEMVPGHHYYFDADSDNAKYMVYASTDTTLAIAFLYEWAPGKLCVDSYMESEGVGVQIPKASLAHLSLPDVLQGLGEKNLPGLNLETLDTELIFTPHNFNLLRALKYDQWQDKFNEHLVMTAGELFNVIGRDHQDLFFNLFERWTMEQGSEDISTYLRPIKQVIPTASTIRDQPFGVTFHTYDGMLEVMASMKDGRMILEGIPHIRTQPEEGIPAWVKDIRMM